MPRHLGAEMVWSVWCIQDLFGILDRVQILRLILAIEGTLPYPQGLQVWQWGPFTHCWLCSTSDCPPFLNWNKHWLFDSCLSHARLDNSSTTNIRLIIEATFGSLAGSILIAMVVCLRRRRNFDIALLFKCLFQVLVEGRSLFDVYMSFHWRGKPKFVETPSTFTVDHSLHNHQWSNNGWNRW